MTTAAITVDELVPFMRRIFNFWKIMTCKVHFEFERQFSDAFAHDKSAQKLNVCG